MLARHSCLQRIRPLLPGLAIGIAYAAIFAFPQSRELRRVVAESEAQSAAIDQLSLREKTLAVSAEDIVSESGTSALFVEEQAITPHLVAHNRSEQSDIQAFTRVLAAFRMHTVECTSAKPDVRGEQVCPAVQRLSLAGSFGNVVAAMEAIEAGIPEALATELSMERTDPLLPCCWEIVYRFREGSE